tara:strand:- start:239 stop:469 length:231 start_codon:yes stop_codon:yes gene_type:complete
MATVSMSVGCGSHNAMQKPVANTAAKYGMEEVSLSEKFESIFMVNGNSVLSSKVFPRRSNKYKAKDATIILENVQY